MSAIAPPPTGHVVVGADGSPAALSAVSQAALEAANRHLPLEIVGAWALPDDAQPDAFAPQMRREAEDATRAAAAHAQALHPGIWTIARVRRGPAHEVLLASAQHASLMVLGSRGHGRMAGLLLGSVSLSVAAYTPCPLLVVRDRLEAASRPDGSGEGLVVVGVEDSDCGPAVEAAYEEAQLRHLRVCALNAIPPVVPTPLGLPAAAIESMAAETAVRQGAVHASLATSRAKHPEIESQVRVVREGASRALVEASREADLVVLAAHRRTARFGTRLGRVSHAVLHHAHAPVLIVPVG
ncbi:universal stress protein [Embleya sp. MST-111070]|uniref:universal stress protein n=1 Tax=Embleya sp. MST-111070 TaxID=3398231 RepID=UPI003F73E992